MHASRLLTTSLLLLSASLFASCGGGGALTTSGSSSGGSNAGGGSGGSLSFSMGDLDGDWTGELIPGVVDQLERNFYVRIADGLVNDSAEGTGGMWSEADSVVTLSFSTSGFLRLSMNSNGGLGKLAIEGTMNLAMTKINGTFTLEPLVGSTFSGTFELRRSNGPGTFTLDLIKGAWVGKGLNAQDKFRLADMNIDDFGNLEIAEVRHPVTDQLVHLFTSASSTSFSFFDDSVGRLNNVVLTDGLGETLTFDFLLVNDQGTLMGGPGASSVLGPGHAELSR